MKAALCREVVNALSGGDPQSIGRQAIVDFAVRTGGKAGVIIVDQRGGLGFAHNSEVMDVATFDTGNGFIYRWVGSQRAARQGQPVRRG